MTEASEAAEAALAATARSVASWRSEHARGAAALASFASSLRAVLEPAPLELSAETRAALLAAPSARLDAFIASGGRHPGQAAEEAARLQESLRQLPPLTQKLEAAAEAAEEAARSLLRALALLPPPADCEDIAECTSLPSETTAPDAAAAAAAALPAEGEWCALLRDVPTPMLRSLFRGLPWGEWVARSVLLCLSLRREAALRRAITEALQAAPAPGGGEGALGEEMADALLTLWKLQPFLGAEQLSAWAPLLAA